MGESWNGSVIPNCFFERLPSPLFFSEHHHSR